MVRVNGVPLELVQPETLRLKAFEPILILGKERFANLDIRIRVSGGGHTSQIYGAIKTSLFIYICSYSPSYCQVCSCFPSKVR